MADVLTIDQLVTGLTPAQVKGKIYDILGQLGVSTTNWKPGGVVRLIISVTSIILAQFSQFIAAIARSAFLTSSTGDWLTLVAKYVYGVDRLLATFATGNVTLTNSQGGTFSFQPGDVVISGPNGLTYRNLNAFSLGANTTATTAFSCDTAGIIGSAGVGMLTTLETSLTGVTVSNVVALIGKDDETDSALIARCLLKPQSLSPAGSRGAYKYFALTAKRQDGTDIGVNRVQVSSYSMTGLTEVIVASPTGTITGTITDPTTDLGAIYASLVSSALPEAVTLHLTTATTAEVNLTFWAYFVDNVVVTTAQQIQVGINALTNWLPTLDIGGVTIPGVLTNKVPLDTMRDVLSDQFVADGYPRPLLVKILAPTTDVTVAVGAVAEPGTVTAQAA